MVTPVLLPTSFTNINYVVFGFPDAMNNNNDGGGYGHVRNKTITNMDMRMMDGHGAPPKSQKIDWVCCGY